MGGWIWVNGLFGWVILWVGLVDGCVNVYMCCVRVRASVRRYVRTYLRTDGWMGRYMYVDG